MYNQSIETHEMGYQSFLSTIQNLPLEGLVKFYKLTDNVMERCEIVTRLRKDMNLPYKELELLVYESERNIYRVKALSRLIPELKLLVWEGKVKKMKAYDLSLLSEKLQYYILEHYEHDLLKSTTKIFKEIIEWVKNNVAFLSETVEHIIERELLTGEDTSYEMSKDVKEINQVFTSTDYVAILNFSQPKKSIKQLIKASFIFGKTVISNSLTIDKVERKRNVYLDMDKQYRNLNNCTDNFPIRWPTFYGKLFRKKINEKGRNIREFIRLYNHIQKILSVTRRI
ncbi:hypothetical protein [Bacillus sp. 1P06AnD]|uniref:hypothetical protein n=1 Tax=Bacillus sp. 1P06AnD TaxID=3132208 RepID=UPI0039A10D27